MTSNLWGMFCVKLETYVRTNKKLLEDNSYKWFDYNCIYFSHILITGFLNINFSKQNFDHETHHFRVVGRSPNYDFLLEGVVYMKSPSLNTGMCLCFDY